MANSKSAYSTPGKQGKFSTHIIVVWVDNESGVLARVVGLFSGRGYNIDSLNVTEVDKKKKSLAAGMTVPLEQSKKNRFLKKPN